MFASPFRPFAVSIRSFLMVAAIVLIAATLTTGAGLASTETNPQGPDSTVDDTLQRMCDEAVARFYREIDWITAFMEANPDFDPDDPALVRHRDSMWGAWRFAEFTCRIDVGGDGEIG